MINTSNCCAVRLTTTATKATVHGHQSEPSLWAVLWWTHSHTFWLSFSFTDNYANGITNYNYHVKVHNHPLSLPETNEVIFPLISAIPLTSKHTLTQSFLVFSSSNCRTVCTILHTHTFWLLKMRLKIEAPPWSQYWFFNVHLFMKTIVSLQRERQMTKNAMKK